MYTFTLDISPHSLKQDLQCYAEMQDGSIVPVRLLPSNCDIKDPTATETITINWKKN